MEFKPNFTDFQGVIRCFSQFRSPPLELKSTPSTYSSYPLNALLEFGPSNSTLHFASNGTKKQKNHM